MQKKLTNMSRLAPSFPIFNAAGRAEIRRAERWWKTKFVIHLIGLLSSLITLAVAAHGYAVTNNGQAVYFLGALIVAPPSVAWCAVNVVVRASRVRPVPQRANFAVDLVLWLALLVEVSFSYVAAAVAVAAANEQDREARTDLCIFATRDGARSDCLDPALRTTANVIVVVAVGGTVSLLAHLTLFVLACGKEPRRETGTHARRRGHDFEMLPS